MPYWRLFYHVVWATKNREPFITADMEEELYESIRRKVRALKGEPFAVNGMPDHTHLVTTIPPTIAVARFIGEVKGSASFHINHLPDKQYFLDWQRGYGALSFSRGSLDRVVEYVLRQKEHHAAGTLWLPLEEMGDDEDAPPLGTLREDQAEYEFW